jgi:prefoldin alpha subunit
MVGEEEEKKMQVLAMEANYYKAMAEELQRRLGALQGMLEEHKAASAALNGLPNKGEAFLPVGGGAYLKGSVSEEKKVLVEIGARVLVETPREQALKIIEKREQDIQHEAEHASEQLQMAVQKLEQVGAAAQSLRSGEAPMPASAPRPTGKNNKRAPSVG